MNELKDQKLQPCHKGQPTLSEQEIRGYLPQVQEWQILEKQGVKRLEREFKFRNFAQALEFTVKVGEMAEHEDHHPVIQTEWGKVTLTWWTHTIGGLHINDFIMAAKSDGMYAELKGE